MMIVINNGKLMNEDEDGKCIYLLIVPINKMYHLQLFIFVNDINLNKNNFFVPSKLKPLNSNN